MVALHEPKPTKKGTVTVVKHVAEQLGNTPAVCRKSYIHPRVLASYLDGSLRPTLAMIEASVHEPEMWAVEGVVMRLLAEWHAGGSKATEAADKAVRFSPGVSMGPGLTAFTRMRRSFKSVVHVRANERTAALVAL
jgi:hypothetical protein